ncbi:hypothetical protein KIH87_13395 [Paraneptunicella aestuarii]|uniref:hypothetical protein n=1 Tax=Paraneptunicella aestuarii TaxID=2831148 RepID=UPI001E3724E0|nr:hypothetical protein [Paraneptunicella aestuarii]UAA37698.1 hypothetical protein KIH87_13395 [Paraneptunicella aestuarii]
MNTDTPPSNKILWMDDEPHKFIYEVYSIEKQKNSMGENYQVIMVSSVEEAIKQLNQEKFAAIIFDQQISQSTKKLDSNQISYTGAFTTHYTRNKNNIYNLKISEFSLFIEDFSSEIKAKTSRNLEHNSKVPIAIVTAISNPDTKKSILSTKKIGDNTTKLSWIEKPIDEIALIKFIESL